ncbi:MAG: hypothetical protein GXO63_01935, partial [Candidatus Micrarchaeota archaeon]|nr:hypothetical protein [Candidatus Micrarchaeota archaeon]
MKRAVGLLVFVVLVSGCVSVDSILAGLGPSQSKNVPGLSVTEFSAMPGEQYAGRNVKLSLYLENTGGASTSAVVCLMGQNFKPDGDYRQGFWTTNDPVCKKTVTINAPQEDIPGGTTSVKWTVTAPKVPVKSSDTFIARVFYRYKTSATVKVPVVSETERIALEQRGEPLPSAEVITSQGPIGISVELSPQTVVVPEGERGYFSMKITIENIGGGYVVRDFKVNGFPEFDEEDVGVVNLKVESPGIDISCDEEGDVELFRDRAVVSCNGEVSGVRMQATYPVFITVSYGYYIDVPL